MTILKYQFSYDELQALLDMSRQGLAQLAEMQVVVLEDIEWLSRKAWNADACGEVIPG